MLRLHGRQGPGSQRGSSRVQGFKASTGTEHRRAAAQSLADFQQGAQRWGSGLPPGLSLSPSTCKARSGMRKRGTRFEQSLRQAWVRRHLLLPEFPQRVSPKGSARSLSLLIPRFVQRRTARSRIPSPSHATLRPPRCARHAPLPGDQGGEPSSAHTPLPGAGASCHPRRTGSVPGQRCPGKAPREEADGHTHSSIDTCIVHVCV